VHASPRSRLLLGPTAAAVGFLLASAAATRLLARSAEHRYPDVGGHVEADGVRLRYTEAGEGPPVVLIHGLLGSAFDFDIGLTDLGAERYRLVAFDRPGSGHSDDGGRRDQSPVRQAIVLHEAAQRLGLERPVLVGYSLGAPVAMAWAELFPADVAAVVSVSGHVMPYALWYAPLMRYLRLPLVVPVASRTVCLPYGPALGHYVLRLACYPQPVPPRYAKVALAVGLRPEPVRHAALDLDHVYVDLRLLADGYGQVELPVVVMGGVRDRIAPFAESEAFRRHLPNARLIAVPDGGHALHVTHPSEVVKAIDLAVAMATTAAAPVATPLRALRPTSASAASAPAGALADEAVA